MNKTFIILLFTLMAVWPVHAESIDNCLGEPVRAVQSYGSLPIIVDGLPFDFPDIWALKDDIVRRKRPISRVLYWTDSEFRNGWLYEDAGHLYLLIFQPNSDYDPVTYVWHGACFLELTGSSHAND